VALDFDLTPAEKAALESGGESVDALVAENPGLAGKDADEVFSPREDEPTRQAAEPAAEDEAAKAAAAAAATAAAAAASTAPTKTTEPPKEEDHIPEEVAGPGGTKRRMVDYRALRQREDKIKALEKQLADDRADRARIDERLRLLTAAGQQQTAEERAAAEAAAAAEAEAEDALPDMPDPAVDIFGAFNGLTARYQRLEKLLERQGAAVTETARTIQSKEETEALGRDYTNDAIAYARQNPEFAGENGAYNFMINARGQQLEAMGHPPDKIPGLLAAEEMELVRQARSQKKSPAALIHTLAKSMGFKPQAQAQDPAALASAAAAAAAATAPNASQQTAAKTTETTATKTPSVIEEIERALAGQAAAKTLSSAGGASAQPLSLEMLANLDDKDFERIYAKHGAEIEKLMSGRAA
jgi:hypothetical protein